VGGKSISTTEQKLGAVSLQSSCYGTCIPIVYGRTRASPNLVYYTDFKAIPHTTTSGGKGGGKTSDTTFTYSATIILAISEGPVSFGTVFHDKDLGTAASFGFTTFPGTLTQAVWPYLSSNHFSDAYNFSGTALACSANMSLNSTATIGNYSFEITAPYSITSGPGAPDANPADIISDFLTNVYYGAVPGLVTIADLTPFRTYCTAMGFWLSPCYDTQKAAADHLKDLMLATNSEIITSSGALKVIPYGDMPVVANGANFIPNTTPEYDLTVSDFIVSSPTDDPIKVKRTSPKDTFNCIPVEFLDRSNYYNTNTVQAIEPVDAATFGVRQDSAKTLHMIVTQSVAQTVSRILGQRSIFLRNEYTFTLGWRFCLLEPMDLLTLTDPKLGFSRKVVRTTKVKEDSKGSLQITAEEWPFGVASATAYTTQSSDVTPVNQMVAPGNINTPIIFDFPTYLTSNSAAALGIVASGGANWGGCQVWMSEDNATYQLAGTITMGARFGYLTSALPAGSPYDTTHTLTLNDNASNAPQLNSISAGYNADFANLALIDNELVSYQNATLTGVGLYSLTNLYRGILGTSIAAHANGARFVRMDEHALEIPITPARIGTTIYFKFISFNIFHQALQALSDVSAYTYVPNPGWNVNNSSDNFTVNGTVNGIAFTWGLNLLPGAYVVELWEGAVVGAYGAGTATKIWEGNATGKLIAKNDTTIRYYWIHARASDGRYGPVVPTGNGTPGAASFINSIMTLVASPGSATSSGAPTSQTTNSVTVTPAGGTPAYTYAWSWHSGGSGLTIGSASAATTTFSATGLALDETRTGTAQCLVTDSASNTNTVFVSVEISETASAVTVSESGTPVITGTAGSETTPAAVASPSGGLAPYTYAWTFSVGGASIVITSPTAASTTFSASGLSSAGETRSGTAVCTVTDSLGQTGTCSVSVSITRSAALSASASPTSETVSAGASSQTTGSTTVTASAGTPGYSYSWAWTTGGSGISIGSASSATTSFTASGLSSSGETRTGTATCTVTDSLGATATATVTVSITRTPGSGITASASPTNLTASGFAPITKTTGTTTVTATGGAPGYSYAWTWASGGTGISATSPSTAATAFTAHLNPGDDLSGTALCTVTDSLGATATCTVGVHIHATN
jgi:hypothetical protein